MLNIVCCVAAVQVTQAQAGYQFMGFFCLIFFCWLPVIFNLMMILYFFLVSLPGAKEHCCHKCSKICRLKDPKDIIDFVSFTSDSENYSKCPLCKEILAFQRSLNNDDWRSYIKLLQSEIKKGNSTYEMQLKNRKAKFPYHYVLSCQDDECKYYTCIACAVDERHKKGNCTNCFFRKGLHFYVG